MSDPNPRLPTVLGTLATLAYAAGGSDKVWAMGVLEENGLPFVVSCWGGRGKPLSDKSQPMPSRVAAEAFVEKKSQEKLRKGYRKIDYRDERYGLLATLQRLLPPLRDVAPSDTPVEPLVAVLNDLGHVVSHVTASGLEALAAAIDDPTIALSEKVNGNRCAVRYDGTNLVAYNRLGKALPGLPRGAEALKRLGVPFLVDGEWLPDGYALFDLLEWQGQDVRDQAYLRRVSQLRDVLLAADLTYGGAPTVAGNPEPLVPGLWLLTPARTAVEKQAVVETVRETGGEGVVLRHLEGPSLPGNTPWERKVKFQLEVDAVVYAVKPGRQAQGSLHMALVRPHPTGTPGEAPAEPVLIDIGAVRAGFTDDDIAEVANSLEQLRAAGLGFLVARVAFLRARTVGVKLVEPRSGPDCIRQDKHWRDCTTAQLVEIFGPERQAAIDAARPLRLAALAS